MRRRQNLTFLMLGVFVAGLLFIDFRILTSSEVVVPRLERMVRDKLGGAVRIGEVQVREPGRIRCLDVRIDPPPDVSATDRVRCDAIEIEYRGALTPGGFEATRLTVRGLKADVGRDTLQYWVGRLTPQVPDATDASGAPRRLPAVRVEGAQIATELPEVLASGERLALRDLRLLVHPLDGGGALGELQMDGGPFGAWSGRVYYDAAGAGARVDVECSGIPVGESLARRMKPEIFGAWANYRLEGPAQVQGRLEFDLSPSSPGVLKDCAFRVRPLGMTGRYKNFPYPIRDLEGEFELLPDAIRIRGIRGRTAGGGRVLLDGRSAGYAAESALDLDIRLERFLLDEDVRAAAPPELQAVWRDVNPAGLVDAQVRVTRGQGKDLKETLDVLVRATDVSVRHAAFPYPVARIQGEAAYRDGTVELRHLEGMRGDARIRLNGRIASMERAGSALELVIEAENLTLDPVLRASVPAAVGKLWDLLQPSGKVDVTWRQTKPEGADRGTRHRVEVRCRGSAIRYAAIPLPVTDLQGALDYDGEALTLRHVSGVCRDAPLTVHGVVRWEEAATDVRLEVGAERLPVDEALLAVLPPRIRAAAAAVGLTGRLDARVRVHHRDGPDAARGHYTAEADLQDCAVGTHLPLTDIRGRVSLEGEIRPAGHTMAGVLALAQARIAGKRLTDVGAVFQLGDDRMTFHDVRGAAYDGTVQMPHFEVDTARGRYEGRARVDGVDLALFVRDTFVAGRPVSGRLSGQLTFGGESGKLETLAGRGKLEIEDGNLWDVPLFLQLVRVLNLGALPSEEYFRSGHVRFAIGQSRVLIESFLFKSEGVTVSGRGRIRFDGAIDLLIDATFSSTLLSEIPGVRQLLDVLKRNLVAVEATGTFQEPELRLKAIPLKDFRAEPKAE